MKLSLLLLFILITVTLNAQTPINFSGKWELDESASSTGIIESDYEGTAILVVSHCSNQ